jgi:predicted nucleic acid-binding protein
MLGWMISETTRMPKKKEQILGVLCDTGFLIRLNNPKDPLHGNARGYLKFFLDERHLIYVSTIALAEYAVQDSIQNLPMRYFRVVPFNIDHAQRAGEYTEIVLKSRDQLEGDNIARTLIKDDSKMFAQADTTEKITHFLTGDMKCETVFNLLRRKTEARFDLLSLQTPVNQSFGMLDLDRTDKSQASED